MRKIRTVPQSSEMGIFRKTAQDVDCDVFKTTKFFRHSVEIIEIVKTNYDL